MIPDINLFWNYVTIFSFNSAYCHCGTKDINHDEGQMKTEDLTIEGMHCGGCVAHVKRELAKLSGVRVENAEVGKFRVAYNESEVTHRDIGRAIQEAGYRLVEVPPSIAGS